MCRTPSHYHPAESAMSLSGYPDTQVGAAVPISSQAMIDRSWRQPEAEAGEAAAGHVQPGLAQSAVLSSPPRPVAAQPTTPSTADLLRAAHSGSHRGQVRQNILFHVHAFVGGVQCGSGPEGVGSFSCLLASQQSVPQGTCIIAGKQCNLGRQIPCPSSLSPSGEERSPECTSPLTTRQPAQTGINNLSNSPAMPCSSLKDQPQGLPPGLRVTICGVQRCQGLLGLAKPSLDVSLSHAQD